MKTTTINGYLVEIESETTEVTQCWVSVRHEGSEYTSSLAALQASGELTNGRDEVFHVTDPTIDKITEWAEANGY